MFSVDYSRSENLQFEDDEYYYYVKAIPKMNVSTQEKTIKRINERYEVDEVEAEEIGVETVKEIVDEIDEIDEELLARSLEEELK